jgi:hypothetical protein
MARRALKGAEKVRKCENEAVSEAYQKDEDPIIPKVLKVQLDQLLERQQKNRKGMLSVFRS